MKRFLFTSMFLLASMLSIQAQVVYSMDSTYTTFTPRVADGAYYYSKPVQIEGNYHVTFSAYTTADTLVGGVSLWVSNDKINWKQWKAADYYPYSSLTTADTIAFARSATSSTYIKHWVFPTNPWNYYRFRWYSGASGTGAAVTSNRVTIKSTYLLKRNDRP